MIECHPVHRDGSSWSQMEIENLTMDDDWVERVAVDMDGHPILLGRFGHYCYADEVTDDMVVIQNER